MQQEEVVRQVAIVEDDKAVQVHLGQIINRDSCLSVAASFDTVAGTLAWLEYNKPDVMLVDLDLPDGSGIDVIRAARARSIECMVITVFADERHVSAAIRAGATGYLLKDCDDVGIVTSIQQLLQGQSPISPGIARHILNRFYRAEPDPQVVDDSPVLTGKETDVLELISRGYSYNEVGERLFMSINTVRTHVRKIYRKLEVNSRSEAVYKASSSGLIDL